MRNGSSEVVSLAALRFYRPCDVVRATGISLRQIWYWQRLGIVTPDRFGRGRKLRRYSAETLVRLKVLGLLRGGGRSLQSLHRFLPVWLDAEAAAGPDLLRATVVVRGDAVMVFERLLAWCGRYDVMLDVPQFLREAAGEKEAAA